MITAWKDRHRSVSGHQGAYEMRESANATLCQGRTGCQWACLPHDLPQKSACAARSVNGPADERTRPWWCWTPRVSTRPPGSPPPRPAGTRRRGCRAESGDWPWTCWAWSSPSSCWPLTPATTKPASPCWTRSPGTPAAPSRRPGRPGLQERRGRPRHRARYRRGDRRTQPAGDGVRPAAKRWRAEQTYGILILHRRLVRDYEHRPASSASRVHWAMTHVMARRLTSANTPTWRGPQAVAA